MTLYDDLKHKVISLGTLDDMCWIWTNALDNDGYGVVSVNGEQRRVHRVAYELIFGAIKKGTVDHLCRNRACYNPGHLEDVSNSENVKRGGNTLKTHCPHDHEYTEENTYINPQGGRECRICKSQRKANYVRRTEIRRTKYGPIKTNLIKAKSQAHIRLAGELELHPISNRIDEIIQFITDLENE